MRAPTTVIVDALVTEAFVTTLQQSEPLWSAKRRCIAAERMTADLTESERTAIYVEETGEFPTATGEFELVGQNAA